MIFVIIEILLNYLEGDIQLNKLHLAGLQGSKSVKMLIYLVHLKSNTLKPYVCSNAK